MDSAVRSFIEEHVPEALTSRVGSMVQPCITALSERCDEGSIGIGESKFGGRPDVPDAFEWPMAGPNPCWFVAQVRLADLQPFDAGRRLPAEGLLSFFYHDDGGPAGSESRVLVFPSTGLRRIDVVPDQRYGGLAFHDRHFPSRTLQFAQGYTLPTDAPQLLAAAGEPVGWGWGAAEEFAEEWNEQFGRGIHQFFGHPTRDSAPRGQQLVARFGLVNDAYAFFVPDGCLERLDFSRLRVVYECS